MLWEQECELKISSEDRGTYTLLIRVKENVDVNVGKLGCHTFKRGFYTYTGSALGKSGMNLKHRIERHLSNKKKEHWHIDYLLSSKEALIIGVIYSTLDKDLECIISKKIEESALSETVVEGFGSSDCRSKCRAHFHYFPSFSLKTLVSNVLSIYAEQSYLKSFYISFHHEN